MDAPLTVRFASACKYADGEAALRAVADEFRPEIECADQGDRNRCKLIYRTRLEKLRGGA